MSTFVFYSSLLESNKFLVPYCRWLTGTWKHYHILEVWRVACHTIGQLLEVTGIVRMEQCGLSASRLLWFGVTRILISSPLLQTPTTRQLPTSLLCTFPRSAKLCSFNTHLPWKRLSLGLSFCVLPESWQLVFVNAKGRLVPLPKMLI